MDERSHLYTDNFRYYEKFKIIRLCYFDFCSVGVQMITHLMLLALSLRLGSITRNAVTSHANRDIGASDWGQWEHIC